MTLNQAIRLLQGHSHVVHVDGDRIIAECVVVDVATHKATIEYGTFLPRAFGDYSCAEIREWLGY